MKLSTKPSPHGRRLAVNRRPTPETDAELYPMNGVDIVWPDFARRLESERDELRSDLEFRRGLFQLQEQQLNDVRKERDELRAYADKLAAGLPEGMLPKDIEVLREANVALAEESNKYKGLLIRLYNDLFVHHKGEAVREFKELFREENYN